MKKIISLFLVSLTLAACSSDKAPSTKTPPIQKKPKIALALGGGAAKGFAHVGVIKVLEREGIKIDYVTGTSAGAVVGCIYADGRNAAQLEKEALLLDQYNLADFTLSTKGLIKGVKLQNYINAKVNNKPLQSLPKKFAAVATNLETGKMIVFRSGNTGQAVRASASIPNIFQPVLISGKNYVDGGLSAPVPVTAAKQFNPDIVIAVDISAKPKKNVSMGFLSIFDQMINIMSVSALNHELSKADIVIRPNIGNLSSSNFNQREEAIKEGEAAAQRAIPQIKAAIKNFK